MKQKVSRFVEQRRHEALIFLLVAGGGFGFLGRAMGVSNMLNTIMHTAHDLLMNTVFYIMGITVLAGALGKLLIEFGVVRLLEMLLAPLMKPLFRLPGVASLGGLMTFFSDNPAIIGLAKDTYFKRYFRPDQLVSLTNFGTAFGMGLIVMTYMSSLAAHGDGGSYFSAALIGFLGAVCGAAMSTRLMQRFIKPFFADLPQDQESALAGSRAARISFKTEGGVFLRLMNAMLDGGKQGVDLGLAIVPGVLIISTLVMMLTFGPADAAKGYQGLAYVGVPVLPYLVGKMGWLFRWLFGFHSPELMAFPVTSLGAVGAALSLVKSFLHKGLVGGNEIAVFTAMGMCWSGYLSTHTAMLDALGYRNLTSKALIAHTVGGLVAGVSAHFGYMLWTVLAT